jgi:hypothetical protein
MQAIKKEDKMKKIVCFSALAALLLSGCQMMEQKKPEQPPRLDLNRRLLVVDEQGAPVGSILFRPLGNGELRDGNGELIGVIVRPQ